MQEPREPPPDDRSDGMPGGRGARGTCKGQVRTDREPERRYRGLQQGDREDHTNGDWRMQAMLDWNGVLKYVKNGNPPPRRRVELTDAEWRARLTPEQYQVTRKKGTERPFSSEMCSLFEPGLYACVCCDTLLFDAAEKFESGTGWPSFTQPVALDVVAHIGDNSYGMIRVETVCSTCDAHLGHVFPDGPPPSGLRYCINAAALKKAGTTGALENPAG